MTRDPKRLLPFDPNRPQRPLMPDPHAHDVVARATVTPTDPTFEVVLRRGEDTKTLFLRVEPGVRRWAGVVGTVVPEHGVAELRALLEEEIAAAVRSGWAIVDDSRR